jgi:hypothetical protein
MEQAMDRTQGILSIVYHEYLNGVDGKRIYREKCRHRCSHWRKGQQDFKLIVDSCDSSFDDNVDPSSPPSISSSRKISDGYEECAYFVNDFVTLGSSVFGKSYLITVGGNHRNEGVTKALEIKKFKSSTELTPTTDFIALESLQSEDKDGLHPNIADDVLTSCDFYAPQDLLSVASQSGHVFLYDTNVMKEVLSFSVDHFGLNFARFTMNGLLATCGLDVDEPVKIFDLRDPSCSLKSSLSLRSSPQSSLPYQHQELFSSSSSSSPSRKSSKNSRQKQTQQRQQKVFSPRSTSNSQQSHSTNFSLKYPAYSCFSAHPCQEKILLGNTSGTVSFWDLRVNASIDFSVHQSIGKWIADCYIHHQK